MKIYIFDGQRPTLQHESAVLVLLFKLASVAAGVDRLKTKINKKNKERRNNIQLFNIKDFPFLL